MRVLDPSQGEQWMHAATEEARKATCERGKGGAVIVKDSEIIGRGYNAPPLGDERNRKCGIEMPRYPKLKQKSDRTCCIHAEWRAIMDALRNHPDKIIGSQLFFAGLDESGAMRKSGKPYCTVCSRLALDAGIVEFVLWHESGITAYPTDEYNDFSYRFFEEEKIFEK